MCALLNLIALNGKKVFEFIMTILLTGASGFLGSIIGNQLSSKGRVWRPLTARLADVSETDLAGIDTVIHCAAATWKADRKDSEYATANAEGTAKLLEICEHMNVLRFIHISTMGVKFNTSYGKSKLLSEEIVKNSKVNWVVLRPVHIIGPNKEFLNFLSELKNKKIQMVTSFGQHAVQMVSAEDYSRAIVSVCESNDFFGSILNVISFEMKELEYYEELKRILLASFFICPTPLFLVKAKFGQEFVEIKTQGLRISGVDDLKFDYFSLRKSVERILTNAAD